MEPVSANDLLFPIGIVVTLVGGGIAFGIQKQRIDSAHERISALEERMTTVLVAIEVKMDAMIRLVERIDERTKPRRREDYPDHSHDRDRGD
jgi:hypothetical protein